MAFRVDMVKMAIIIKPYLIYCLNIWTSLKVLQAELDVFFNPVCAVVTFVRCYNSLTLERRI